MCDERTCIDDDEGEQDIVVLRLEQDINNAENVYRDKYLVEHACADFVQIAVAQEMNDSDDGK